MFILGGGGGGGAFCLNFVDTELYLTRAEKLIFRFKDYYIPYSYSVL